MPSGGEPPIPRITDGVFTTVSGLTYDSTSLAFKDGSGTAYFLFVEKRTGGSYDEAQWFCATDADGGSNPKGLIPQITANVMLHGTYNATNQTVTYEGQQYRLQLSRDTSNGNQLAKAAVV